MAHTISGASLDGIYNRLNSIQRHHPLEAETFSDWSVEAGDIVTISRDGKSYQSPIHSSTIKWKGKTPTVSVNSTGNEKREAVSKVSRQKYNRGGGGLRNSQKIYGDVWSEDGHVHSFVNQTASRIYGYVDDVYNQMRSGLELTSSTAALYVQDAYNQMTSGLELTSSTAALYVQDAYNQMTSGLQLTSSTAALYVQDAYNQMTSGLQLTSSTAALYVQDSYNQMTSGLELTSSTAALYVQDAYNQMTSGLALTSSSAALYVSNSYTRMTAGLKATSSSAVLYAKSADNAAEIVARINESTGESEIHLSSDKVYIGNEKSTTVINGKCSLSDVTADFISNKIAAISNLNVNNVTAASIRVTVGQSSSYVATETYVNGSVYDLQIVDNQNNTYTLQKKALGGDGSWVDVGTFSKAASTLSGSWSGGTFTVTASPQGNTFSTQIVQGETSWDGNTATVPVEAIDSDQPAYQYGTGRNISVDASARYTAGQNSVSINKGSWSGGQVQFSKSAGTGTTRGVLVGLSGSWNGSSYEYTIKDYYDDPSGTSTGYTGSIDASDRYTAGQNSVTINKGSWSGGQIQFTKSAGTASTKGVRVGLDGSWNGSSYNYTIKDYYDDASGVSTGYTGSVDASTAYNNGGKTAYVRKARTGDYSDQSFILEVPSSSVTLGSPLYIRARAGYFDSDGNGQDTEHYGYIKVNVPAASHSPRASVTLKWTGDISGRTSLGSANASELANTYILINASCGGQTKKYYITINA